jgi:transposase
MSIFRPWNYDSDMLLPPSPRDWLSDDHEAFLLADIVRRLTKDDPILNRVQPEGGRPAYHPIMMSIVLIFSYMRGVHSSRRIERLLEENLAYKAISGDQTPDFRTLCRFRKANLAWFELLLKRSIHVGYALGLIDLGAVIVDGTPIQASANKSKSRRLKTLQRLKSEERETLAAIEAKRLVAQAEALDNEEDSRFGDDGYPRPLLRQKVATTDRLARIEQAIALAAKAEQLRRAIIRKAKARILRKARPAKRRLKRTCKKGRKLDAEAGRKVLAKLSRLRIPKPARVNTTDPESMRLKAKNGGFLQGYQVIRVVDSKAGMILHNHVSPTGGESRELLPAILATKQVLGVPQLLRALADMGYSGEPNLKLVGREHVHELLIPQAKRATKSALIREQKALNARRTYWLKRRGRIEATNGSTKEARGLRQFRIRGRLGAAIELSLDAVAHNLQKLFSVLQDLSEPKLKRSLRNAAMAGA